MRILLEFGEKKPRTGRPVGADRRFEPARREGGGAAPAGLLNTVTAPGNGGDVVNPTPARPRHEPNWTMPWQVRTGAMYAGAFLLIAAATLVVWFLFNYFADVTIPLAIALLFTALMWPLVNWLEAKGVWRSAAAALAMIFFFGIVIGLFSLVGAQLADQVPALVEQARRAFAMIPKWIQESKLPGSEYFDAETVSAKLESMTGSLISSTAYYVKAVGTGVSHFAAGLILSLFATFFFLYDGRRMLRAGGTWLREPVRKQLRHAGGYGWKALVAYVRAISIVAAVDGLFVGLGALILGSSFALSIGVLTFLLAFIPLLGAFLAGVVAVLVVLVTLGFWKAVAMLIIYLLVNQLEGNVLHPFLLGKSVDLHPLLVLVGIAVGLTANGIIGALLIVPALAFASVFIKKLGATDAAGNLLEPVPARD